jgi:hypothetical protein
MKSSLLPAILMATVTSINAQQFIADGRFPLAVLPVRTKDVAAAVKSLNGTWKINTSDDGDIWQNDFAEWKNVTVPGEPAMQGFSIKSDKEFYYKKDISIPADAKNKTILIRFNGVYSYARVFVNGHFVREHFGGFTAWDADITSRVEPGKNVTVYVGVTDRMDDISYASGYAKHCIGGILRDVQLIILPQKYINRLYVQTELKNDFKQANLLFTISANKVLTSGKISLQIVNPYGKKILKQPRIVALNNDSDTKFSITINDPVLWNDEQPFLYMIQGELLNDGMPEEVIHQNIGIREVKIVGNRVEVNGQSVKLRGVCRHDMKPLSGRSSSRYYDSLDVTLAKEANMNFIRTSHYPPSQDFLEFADKLGLYVEEETAICFVNDWRTGGYKILGETSDDSAFTSRYLGQLSEMVDRDRNHPAVIIWSIGNESNYGSNFQKEYDFIKSVDLTRPVSWTWPSTAIKENKRCFDIAVSHYPNYNGSESENFGLPYKNMEHEKYPLLSDEWAHVPCYCTTLLKEDPGIGDFWGRSLDSMWTKRFDVQGNLGGAIWGMIDETFFLPDSVVGYGPWGIVDVWRRKKAEFWNTKKAYSPIKILQTNFQDRKEKNYIVIPVKNRFDHISLNQIRMKIIQEGNTVYQPLPALKPHEEGEIKILLKEHNKPVFLQFFDSKNNLIDEELISTGRGEVDITVKNNLVWEISQNDSIISLKQNKLNIQLKKLTGQLLGLIENGQMILAGNPKLLVHIPDTEENPFNAKSESTSEDMVIYDSRININDPKNVVVESSGFVNSFPFSMKINYNANGTVHVDYLIDSIKKKTLQIGVSFLLDEAIDEIKWKRNGYWTTYPDGHLSGNEGSAMKRNNVQEPYRLKPTVEIAKSMNDYYLNQTTIQENAKFFATESYRATKENIISLKLFANGKEEIDLFSNGTKATKMNLDKHGQQELQVLGKWDYWSLAWGNYEGSENANSTFKGDAEIRITTTK